MTTLRYYVAAKQLALPEAVKKICQAIMEALEQSSSIETASSLPDYRSWYERRGLLPPQKEHYMSLPQQTLNTQSDPSTPYQLILQPLRTCTLEQAPELIKDFFNWLANEWGQPVIHPNALASQYELLDRFAFRSLPPEGLYTCQELVVFSGLSWSRVSGILRQRHICPAGNITKKPQTTGPLGTYRHGLFRGQDLTELVDDWEFQRLLAIIYSLGECFAQPSCKMCTSCRRNPPLPPIFCPKNRAVRNYRISIASLLKGLYQRSHGANCRPST